jgi:probable HAF family extracellular repeat protein
MVDLNDLPGGSTHCMAWRISADGSTVVGESDSASGREAFRWTQSGGMVGLGDLPGGNFKSIARGVSADGSVVVGEGSSTSGQEAFRWTQSGGMVELGVLSGCTNSVAMNVSADGLVVVGFCGSASGTEPFRWTQSTGMVRIGDNPAGQLFPPMALAASADGSMIVGVANLVRGAFIWDAAHGIRRLQTVLQTDYGLKVAGWRNFSAAFDISPDGSAIAGFGTNPSGQTEAFRAVLDVIPKLAISLSDANVNLAWSSNFPDFALESTGQVAGTWTPVPDVTGYSATLPVNAQSQFFRLRK